MPLRDAIDPKARAMLSALRSARFMFGSEAELQDGVAEVLSGAGIAHIREVALTERDRIDFMAGDVGMECKIDHGRAALLRQLFRYARTGRVTALVVVLGKMQLATLPDAIEGVPIHIVHVVRAFG